MSKITIEQELALLRAENASLKAQAANPRKLTPKVSLKGALSLYGMGRFPITLYKEQWLKLLAKENAEMIQQFIRTNDALLKAKGDATDVPAASAVPA